MPDREQQEILNQINDRYRRRRNLEAVGWIAFMLGLLVSSLFFILYALPLAEEIAATEAVYEYQQTQSQCPSY